MQPVRPGGRCGALPGAGAHDAADRQVDQLLGGPARFLPDSVDGPDRVRDPAHPVAAGPLDDLGAPEQLGVLAPFDGVRDRLVAHLAGVGDPHDGDRPAVAREARGVDGGGVVAVQGDARLGEGLVDGGRVGAQGAFLAVGHEGHGAFGADGEGQAGAGDPCGGGGGEVRPLDPDPEGAQGSRHGVGGRPDLAADAVEGEGERPPVVDDDLVAVVEARAGGRGDDVVRADGDALLRQEPGDVVSEGVQGPGRAVDLQPDGLVVGDERGGAAGQEGDDEGLRDETPQALGVCDERPAALGGPPGAGPGGALPGRHGRRRGERNVDHRRSVRGRGVRGGARRPRPVRQGRLLVERAEAPVLRSVHAVHAAPEDPPAAAPSCAGTIAELR